MGKQIEFFIAKQDEIELLRYFEEKSVFYSKKKDLLTIEGVVESNELTVYICCPQSKIIVKDNGFIDAIESDVIHYSRGFKHKENVIEVSRIWAEFKYYDGNQNIIQKEEWFEQFFEQQRKYIKKSFKISKCKRYYIGKEAYKFYKDEGFSLKAGPKQLVEC